MWYDENYVKHCCKWKEKNNKMDYQFGCGQSYAKALQEDIVTLITISMDDLPILRIFAEKK